MKNRIPRIDSFLPPSIGDKLIKGAYGCEIELIRFRDEESSSECHCTFKLTGTLTEQADARQLLRTILDEFDRPMPDTEGGVS